MADIADNLTPEEIEEDKKFESEMYGKCGWDRMCQMKTKAEREQAREASASSETISIEGAIDVPAASSFSESQITVNELMAQNSSFAKVPNIDLCGFLGGIEPTNFDLPNIRLGSVDGVGGLPSMNDIMGGINGVTLPALQGVSTALTDLLGQASQGIGDMAKAIQGSIPTISCGAPTISTIPELPSTGMGDALKSTVSSVGIPEVASPLPYGTTPNIIIESPDVTVQSLDDEIDSGEF